VFDEVTKREGGMRAASRSAWLLGSTALQTALVLGVIFLSTALARRVAEAPLVDVRFVKPAALPAPPPPPPAPRRKTTPQAQKPKTEAKPRPAMIQPKEMPQELKPPDPSEPPEPEDQGSDDGVEGGVVGGVVGDVTGITGGAPPPPQPTRAPVEFNNTMTAPVLIAGPPLEYTQQALEREVEGQMIVKCTVTIEGAVQRCRVLRTVPFMDRAVVSVLEHRRYKPATQGGKALDVDYTFNIKLKLPQ
jgi:protein TonB